MHECSGLLLAVCIAAVLQQVWSEGCTKVDGYTFNPVYPRDVNQVPGYKLISLEPRTSNNPLVLAAVCDRRPGCTAFTTTGQLLNVLEGDRDQLFNMKPVDAASMGCHGVYVLQGKLQGRWAGVSPTHGTQQQGQAQPIQADPVVAGHRAQHAGVHSTAEHGRGMGHKPVSATTQHHDSAAGAGASSMSEEWRRSLQTSTKFPKWDSRSKNWVSPVRNQGACGSCVSFATSSAAETAIAVTMKNKATNRVSPHWMFFCNPMSPVDGCRVGWSLYSARNSLVWYPYQTYQATPSETCVPYRPDLGQAACTPSTARNCTKPASSVPTMPSGYFEGDFTQTSNVSAVQEAIRTYGSVVVCYHIYQDFYNYQAGTIYKWTPNSGAYDGNHCVQAVGYDNTQAYWLVKNSWGTGWGDQGYFKIHYANGVYFMAWEVLWFRFSRYFAPPPSPPMPPFTSFPPPPPPFSLPTRRRISCEVALSDGAGKNVTLHQAVSWTDNMPPNATWVEDLNKFEAGNPFANKSTTYNFTCVCEPMTPTDCYSLGQYAGWKYYRTAFTTNNGGPNGYLTFTAKDCDETRCTTSGTTASLPPPSSSSGRTGYWQRAISSMAITLNWRTFTPIAVVVVNS